MTPRVLVVHNQYRSELPSGENNVVDGQIDLLRSAGVEVETYLRSSDEITSFSRTERIELVWRPIYSREAVSGIDTVIDRFRPDVMHVHNVYPLISPAVITAARARGCRVVQTVHNFRHICASGSFFRDGRTCTECLGKRLPLPAVQHGCYRGSRAQSVVMGTAIARHRKTWLRIDRFLPVSAFVADMLATTGIPRDQIRVVPNSVIDPGPPAPLGSGVVFVGRLDDQKGITLLIDAWERSGLGSETELTILGDGPERSRVERAVERLPGLLYGGPVSREQVATHMRASRAVVVPPIGLEALPTVVLESYASGRPVVATKVGPLESLVPRDAGWLADPNPPALAEALTQACRDPRAPDMATRARELYVERYSPAAVLEQLLGAYEGVLAPRRDAAPGPARSSQG